MIHVPDATRVTVGPMGTGGIPLPTDKLRTLRITFQPVSREGRKLEMVAQDEGVERSDEGELVRTFHGWRKVLTLKWSFTLNSHVEEYTDAGWVSMGDIPTAQAVWLVMKATDGPALRTNRAWVEPFGADPSWPGYFASPLTNATSLKGALGQLINKDLELVLEADTVIDRISPAVVPVGDVYPSTARVALTGTEGGVRADVMFTTGTFANVFITKVSFAGKQGAVSAVGIVDNTSAIYQGTLNGGILNCGPLNATAWAHT